MYYESVLQKILLAQDPRGPKMKDGPAFYRRLEEAMDVQRRQRSLMCLKPRWDTTVADFTTSDFLSLNRTGQIRDEFYRELQLCGSFELSASGSRVQYGNSDYIVEVEREIAAFHRAETAFICHSGFFANVGILEAIPQPGDAIVLDEFSHASTRMGLKVTLAAHKLEFRHNSLDSFQEVLVSLKSMDNSFATGEKSILICVESIYSMQGDICPLKEMVDIVKELFPAGNAQFVIDEAHSTGVLGPNGAGLVSLLGLEKEIAIRVHMCSKALSSTGGVILCNQTIRSALVQYSRCLTYSGAPSVPMIASIRAGYNLLRSGRTTAEQNNVQRLIKYFFSNLLEDPRWQDAMDEGLIAVPLAEDWEDRSIHSHIVAVKISGGHEFSLFAHLAMANMQAYPISYPTVPKGTGLVRCLIHAHNTTEELDRLVSSVGDWAEEIMDIQRGGSSDAVPGAIRRAMALQASGWREQ